MDNKINEEFSRVKSPTLSINPEDKVYRDPFATAPSLKTPCEDENTDASAGSVYESQLSEEERKQVDEFVKQIDVSDVKLVNSYGANAQNGIATFSSSITNNVRAKEFGDVGVSLRELRVAIDSTVVPERKGIFKLFQKGKQQLTYLISNYESAEASIRKI